LTLNEKLVINMDDIKVDMNDKTCKNLVEECNK